MAASRGRGPVHDGGGDRSAGAPASIEARLRRAEQALAAIEDETQHALHHPETCVTVLCRIATLVSQARSRGS